MMKDKLFVRYLLAALLLLPSTSWAVSSSELYQVETHRYGRFEARVRFAAGSGVVSSFFLWKPGSEVAGTFWNELDFEKLEGDCRMQTNPLYGDPVIDNGELEGEVDNLCSEYHTYAFEWTPTYIAWFIDGTEVRREQGVIAEAFEQNAASGMQIHFNVWPGDETFGGDFDPSILPVQQFVSWVRYSRFADGVFELQWQENFDSNALPAGWALGNWDSPKNYSLHSAANVNFADGIAVLSLTADDALGFNDAPPADALVEPQAPSVTEAMGEETATSDPNGSELLNEDSRDSNDNSNGDTTTTAAGNNQTADGAMGSASNATATEQSGQQAAAVGSVANASGGESGCSFAEGGSRPGPRTPWMSVVVGLLMLKLRRSRSGSRLRRKRPCVGAKKLP